MKESDQSTRPDNKRSWGIITSSGPPVRLQCLCTTPWAWQSKQFFICLSRPCVPSLSRRMPRETSHKALDCPLTGSHFIRGGSLISQTSLRSPVLGNGTHQDMPHNLPWMSGRMFVLPSVECRKFRGWQESKLCSPTSTDFIWECKTIWISIPLFLFLARQAISQRINTIFIKQMNLLS